MFYILEALREHLGNVEDADMAQQRLAALCAGCSRTFSTEDVRAEPGLNG